MLHTILLTCCSWEFWLVQFFEDLTDFHLQLGSHKEKQKVEDPRRLRLLRGFHGKSNASLSLKMMKNISKLISYKKFTKDPLLRFKFTHFSLHMIFSKFGSKKPPKFHANFRFLKKEFSDKIKQALITILISKFCLVECLASGIIFDLCKLYFYFNLIKLSNIFFNCNCHCIG